MTKFVVLFFACVILSTAYENPVIPVTEIFKNGRKPTHATVNAAIQECIILIRKMFNKEIVQQPDIHKTVIIEHEHPVELEFTNGQLRGIETIYIIDAPTVDVKNDNSLLIVPFRYANYTVTYDYVARYSNEEKEGKFAEDFGFRCDISFLTDHLTLKVSSYNIKCKNDGQFNIQVEGVTHQGILAFLVPIFKEIIEDVTREKLKEIIVYVLNDYNSSI